MKRFSIAKSSLTKAKNMARAVRSEVSSLLVSTPISLLSLLIFYSAIPSGELMPFNPEMKDSLTHTSYMSKYLFYQGFVSGTIISIMANTWMKVQVDDRIEKMGGFYDEPLLKDQKRGFWRYYIKNAYKHPNNTWWQNHSYYLKLVVLNIPASLVMYTAIYAVTLGRFELGGILASYSIYFLTPISGINTKLEQGFELASKWINGLIPIKYRANNNAQQYINQQIQFKRNIFNFFFTIYETVQYRVLGIFQMIETEEFGSRSYLRLMFNGWTPTEIVASAMRKLAERGEGIPGVKTIAQGIEYIFTNNYDAWEKIGPNSELFPEAATEFNAEKPISEVATKLSEGAASTADAVAKATVASGKVCMPLFD